MNRNITIISIILIIAIIATIVAFPTIGQSGNQNRQQNQKKNQQTGVYQCVKKYVVNNGDDATNVEKLLEFVVPSSLPLVTRIDLRAQDGSICTMECNDDFWEGITNSDYRYAQFKSGKWYSIKSIGEGDFPNIIDIQMVPDPKTSVIVP